MEFYLERKFRKTPTRRPYKPYQSVENTTDSGIHSGGACAKGSKGFDNAAFGDESTSEEDDYHRDYNATDKDIAHREDGASGGHDEAEYAHDMEAKREHLSEAVDSTHTISITTGTAYDAGTNTRVFLILNGERKRERVELNNGPLRSGTTETFHKKLNLVIRPITSIIIGHNRGDSLPWFCEKIEVKCHTTEAVDSTHTISITTGTAYDAGTNTRVFLILNGERKRERVELNNGPLRSGTTETFHKKLNLVIRPITSIIIGHNRGDSLPWFCEKIEVKCHTTEPLYTITVLSGKKNNAGTDAKVSITLHGKLESNYITEPVPPGILNHDDSCYTFATAIPFVVKCVEIGHDNTGESPDWFCDQVTVRCKKTDVEQVFPCKKWLSKTKGDGSIRRRLYEKIYINNDELRRMCENSGRTSSEVSEACKRISLQIMSCSRSFIEVLPSYRPSNPDNIVFVVFTAPDAERNSELPHSLITFEIVYRKINDYKIEDIEIGKKDKLLFSEKDVEHAKNQTNILQKNSCHLMNAHYNLSIITASPIKTKGFVLNKHTVKRQPCIVFYVSLKGYIPLQEEELPSLIGTYKTDVREGAFKFYNGPEPYMQALKIGCSIGEDSNTGFLGGTGGTLGAFVNLPNGKVGCITSAHTLLSSNKMLEFKHSKRENLGSSSNTIYQPAPAFFPNAGRQPFGRVASIVYKTGDSRHTGVEAGLITIQDRNRFPDNRRFPRVAEGFTDETQFNYMSGNIFTSLPDNIGQYSFYKYGANTEWTRGAFRLQGSAVRTGSMTLCPNCELYNQIEICSVDSTPFAKPGDSGALVLVAHKNDTDDLRAIGILTGGTNDCTMFYVTPIWDVLNALDLPLQLKNFIEHIPMMIDDENGYAKERSETDIVKADLGEFKININQKVDKLTETVGQVETKIGNLEGMVNRIGSAMSTKSEMKANFANLLSAINSSKTNNNN